MRSPPILQRPNSTLHCSSTGAGEDLDTTVIHSRLRNWWADAIARMLHGSISRLKDSAAPADYEALDNSRLDLVLERRSGIPITLRCGADRSRPGRGGHGRRYQFSGTLSGARERDDSSIRFEMSPASEAQWQQRVGSGGLGALWGYSDHGVVAHAEQHKAASCPSGTLGSGARCARLSASREPVRVLLAVERSEYWLRSGCDGNGARSLEEALAPLWSSPAGAGRGADRRLRG